MIRAVALASLGLVLGGCSWLGGFFSGKDNAVPPAALAALEPELRIHTLWRTRMGAGAGGQFVRLVPLVAGGRVFAADREGRVAAFDTASGERLWETDTGAVLAGGPGGGEGLVLVGTSGGEVVALRADDGREAWRARVSSEVLSVPRAADGVVVVRTVDGRLAGLDASTGRRLWVYDRSVPVLTLRGTGSPVISEGIVVCGFDSGKLVALTLREGKVLWEAGVAVPRGRSELERLVDIDGDPRVGDGVVYAVAFQGRLAALDLETGDAFWTRPMSSFAGLGMDGTRLYVTDEHSHVWAVSRRNGAALWKQDKLHDRALTAPAAFGGQVVVGDFEGYLHWLSREDGHLMARVRVDDEGIISAPVAAGDTLYVYGKGGVLAAYQVVSGE